MRIAIISLMEGFPWGGSEELWHQVALRVLESKHELLLCVKEWDTIPPKIAALQSKGARIVFRSINPKKKGWSLFERKNSSPEWLRGLEKFNPQFILVSQGGTFDVLRKADLVEFLAHRTGNFSLLSQFNFEHAVAFSDEMKSNFNALNGKWRKFYFVAARNRAVAEQQAGMPIACSAIVDNPVNLASKDPLPWPDDQILRLACVARYQFAMKGQDKLLAAINELPMPSREFTLDFYGEGPDKQALLGLVAASPHKNRIRVNGHSGNIDDLWSTHHAMVLPSLAEGTPLSVQEAMYKGRPVLATDVGDCSKLVIEGKTGFLSADSSLNNLRSAFDRLLNTADTDLQSMGIAAAHHILQTINPDAAEDILRDIIS